VIGGPHTWKVFPMDQAAYYGFMTELGTAAKETQGELGIKHPVLLGIGAGMLLGVKNANTGKSDQSFLASIAKAFDGLAVNFYGGRKSTDGRVETIQTIFQIGKEVGLPIFISETGKWAKTPSDPSARGYRDLLFPFLRKANNLAGVTWFEATDEEWKYAGDDPKFGDSGIENHYGILGKELQRSLFEKQFPPNAPQKPK
jgi:hypothetical protein